MIDELLRAAERMTWPDVQIHRTAEVEQGAVIGPGTKVWHFAHIRSGAVIGRDCVIGKDCYIDEVFIGDRVKIQNGVSVYRGVYLDDDVFVGPHAVFTNDPEPRSQGAWVCVPTIVRRGASIGANATILCGVEIGEWAMVGAGAVVTHNVPAGRLVYGNPARDAGPAPKVGA
jgi:UDP-2-acetamido-3-amino-2,3-dideoxy-glucuronate N-acetyltransferase